MPRVLVRGALIYLGCAAALHLGWILTGREAWILTFRVVNGAFLVSYATIAAWQAIVARRFFASRDPLRLVWSLLTIAALVRAAGHVLTYVFAWPAPHATDGLAQFGRILAGPGYMALVAIALAGVIRVYHRGALLARLHIVDLVLVLGVGLFAAQFVRDLAAWGASGQLRVGLLDIVGWTSDPLLAILLLEAILLRRAAINMGAGYVSMLLQAVLIKRSAAQLGAGYVSRCWSAFAAGIFLTSLGDIGSWAEARLLIEWPWTSIIWYIWPLAETAFAVAPAWQIAACRLARGDDPTAAGAVIVRPLGMRINLR